MKSRRRAVSHLRGAHQLRLFEGAVACFEALIQDIDQSRQEVRMETYIFAFDAAGRPVAQALERAAARGVNVYLTVDGFGTPRLPPEWVERFNRSGVQWRIFLPLGRVGLLIPIRWRRLHRKLCVVDGATAYCGGINVMDDFSDPNHGALKKPRLDFALRVTGPLVHDVSEVMTRFWWRHTPTNEVRRNGLQAAWRDLLLSLQRVLSDSAQSSDALAFSPSMIATVEESRQGAFADLVLRDNLLDRRKIERAYLRAIGSARREVIIANAYFLPGARLRRALIHAARRGVRVRLLLQGRYEYFLQYHATRPMYGKLLEAGVEIYEYRASFMHAKVAVVDGRWATVGSSNLDPLSLLLAREANVVVDDAGFAEELRERLELAITQSSSQVQAASFANRSWHLRVLEIGASMALRAGILLTGRRY
ncbi:MAG: cardiolipin synthase ClsB [Rhodoferax sp.]|nr:cardiolipin synthase ClsB [Rhodoferax sp.]